MRRLNETFDMAGLDITQRECEILDLLEAHPHLLMAEEADAHRLHVQLTAAELTCEGSTESSEPVILHYHRGG